MLIPASLRFPLAPSGRALAGVVFLAAAPGCVLDFSGLSGGTAAAPEDAATQDDGSFDGASPDAESEAAACSLLSCGACQQPCPSDGCPALELATGAEFADSPRGLAIDSDALVWVNRESGRIVRLSGASSSPELLVIANQPVAVAASSGFIAWAERDGVWACSASDCESTRKPLGNSIAPGSVANVVLDGKTAYWTDRGAGVETDDGLVQRCDVESCTSAESVATKQYRAYGLFVGGGHVFWTNQGDGFETGSVFLRAKSGGVPGEIVQGQRLPAGVAADDTYVYWARGTSDGRILRCAYLEGYCNTPVDVAPAAGDLGHPGDLVIAGSRLYFSTTDDGTVRSCPEPQCGQEMPTVHVSGRMGLGRIAVGSSCLFWTDGEGGGRVMKVAR